MSILVGGVVVFRESVELDAQAKLAWEVVAEGLAQRVHIAWGPYSRAQQVFRAMGMQEVDRLGGWQCALPFMIASDPTMDIADELFVYDPPAEHLRDGVVDLNFNRDAVERVAAVIGQILNHAFVDRVKLYIDADATTTTTHVRIADLARAIIDAYTPQGDVPSIVFEVQR